MTDVVTQTARLREAAPPWLQRAVGKKFLDALGAVLDLLDQRIVEGVSHRFPNLVDASSLAMIGRERRIRRGPGEDAQTYADRLVLWWDMHRLRGGPYALLWNLFHFFKYWLPGRKDVVYHNGIRRWIDTAGDITRDAITWDADGSDKWAQVWVFFYVPETIPLDGEEIVTTWNELITTMGGEAIVTLYSVTIDALTPAEEEVFKAIPREWTAGHIWKTHVVLLANDACLVGYPPRTIVNDLHSTVGPTSAPVILTINHFEE